MKYYFLLLFIPFFLSACWGKKDMKVMGYAPVYASDQQIKTITLMEPVPYELAGKIFVIGTKLFQVETGKGFHITDISNPSKPRKAGFVKVAGCAEIAVKSGHIYTNNMQDLVVLDIADGKVNVVRRVPGVFKDIVSAARPPEPGRFECPDSKKGIVVGWERKELINPQCFY